MDVSISTTARSGQPGSRRRRWMILGSLVLLAAIAGATTGYFARLDMPGLQRLEEYAPAQMTRILARDGSQLASFAAEKRILLDYGEIPESFRQALIASEDSRFERHAGIDPIGGARVVWRAMRQGHLDHGASTLTMQLAGNMFLDRSQRTLRRKLQEMFLALEIERQFSKQEIFRMYCNQVHFGHGLYGLQAAARYYFDKPARALTTGESAMLVGLLPRPASYSPFRSMEEATRRRRLVLRRMVSVGSLTAAEAKRIAAEPIAVSQREGATQFAPYFTEDVRRWLQESYGSGELYRGGMEVRTTLDRRLQEIATRAVQTGLRQLQQRQGPRSNEDHPPVEAALIAIDPRSGEIRAQIGGSDFARSEYNRATQARRQTGSLFKPFVYAAALSHGWTLADTLLDEPTVFLDPSNPVPYQPENFSRTYHGTITLRTAMEKSVNIATVKLLEQVGYDAVIDTTRSLGVRSRLRPYPSLALGAFELTLLEVTSAYGAFANQGLLMEPHGIREIVDRQGRTIQRARPHVTQAVSPQVAYLTSHALSGVIRHGTGRTAGAVLEHTLAGKTGTTDDNTDAWFVGYTPHLVVGVWVGYDEPRSLGNPETGARAALPIWIEFMREALAAVPDEPFPVPAGIKTVPIDAKTGKRPDRRADCADSFAEVFIAGTEPAEFCSLAMHRKLLLPYPFQRYPHDANGTLRIPRNELERVLERERDVRLKRRRGMLEIYGAQGLILVPLNVLPARDLIDTPPLDESIDTTGWIGTDGRRAQVTWFGRRP